MLGGIIFFCGLVLMLSTTILFTYLLPYKKNQATLLPIWELMTLTLTGVYPIVATLIVFSIQSQLDFPDTKPSLQLVMILCGFLFCNFILSAMSATISKYLLREYSNKFLRVWYGSFFVINMLNGAAYLYLMIGVILVNQGLAD